MKTVLFLHGLESTPGGKKPTFLKEQGYKVINPSLPKDDFEESVKIAQVNVYAHRPDFIVGSSRGGAVAMAINTLQAPTVLIAPAWKKYGVPNKTKNSFVLHCENDDIVPFEDTQELFRNSEGTTIVSCGEDHRMSDAGALEALKEAIGCL